ncbi:MAG: class I SAM-dependent methyltransferase [Oscillospiraceae bacterium]|nr:class I SAM-dependent methyltransferase [Oscillospiraceae bacterium]
MNKNYIMQHWYATIYDQKVIQDDFQHILSIIGDTPVNILEVACGSGRISIPLAEAGHSVTGFDIDEYMLARIPHNTGCLTNFKYFKADALSDDWGNGFDVVVLAGNVLVNIITDDDYTRGQELFIKKAAACVKQSGHLYLDFDCVNWQDSSPEHDKEWIVFEGTDDLGTYGKYIVMSGEYSSKTRINKGERRYEITPNGGEMFAVVKPLVKHFPTYEQVISWLEKYGWEIEWQAPVSEETFHAIIWARKI